MNDSVPSVPSVRDRQRSIGAAHVLLQLRRNAFQQGGGTARAPAPQDGGVVGPELDAVGDSHCAPLRALPTHGRPPPRAEAAPRHGPHTPREMTRAAGAQVHATAHIRPRAGSYCRKPFRRA